MLGLAAALLLAVWGGCFAAHGVHWTWPTPPEFRRALAVIVAGSALQVLDAWLFMAWAVLPTHFGLHVAVGAYPTPRGPTSVVVWHAPWASR